MISISSSTSEIKPQIIRGSAVKILLDSNLVSISPTIIQTLERNFDFNYHSPPLDFPYQKYLQVAEYIRKLCYPQLSVEAGYEQIGYQVTQYYFRGTVGGVLKIMANVLGPEQGAKHFVKKMQNILPWGQHELTSIGPTHAVYRKRFVPGPPSLMHGIMRASLEASGAKNLRLSAEVLGAEDIVHRAEWQN